MAKKAESEMNSPLLFFSPIRFNAFTPVLLRCCVTAECKCTDVQCSNELKRTAAAGKTIVFFSVQQAGRQVSAAAEVLANISISIEQSQLSLSLFLIARGA